MWISTPIGIVNKSTGLDLSTVGLEELNQLKQSVQDEINENHTPVTRVSDWLLYLVKLKVEQHFWQQEIGVSWAWTEYEYTRDWDHYSLTTHIDYTDPHGSKQKPTVYAEAFPRDGRYELYYLIVGDQTIIDIRNQLPKSLNRPIKAEEATGVPTSEPTLMPTPNLTPTPSPVTTHKPTPTPTPVRTQKPTSKPTLTPTPTPTPAPTTALAPEQNVTSANVIDNESGKMVKIVHTSSVNVRMQPNADSEKVGTAKSGGVYQYLETADNGWHKIRLENGMEGWISGKMAERIEGDAGVTAKSNKETKSDNAAYKVPEYEIVDNYTTGIGLPQYWVYTRNIDYSTDAYREEVKAIFSDMAYELKTDRIIVDIVTDREIIYFNSDNTIVQYMDKYGMDVFAKLEL